MDKDADIKGLRLHYQDVGSGNPLIIMHGWGCNATTVASITAIAAETHHVYAVDFPGFGQTPEPPAVWGVEDYTQFIEEFVRTLGIEKPALLGHSFGGRVGILYASRNATDRLILVDAAGVKPRRPLKYYLKVYSFKTVKWLARTFMPREKAEAWIAKKRNKSGSSDYNNATPRMKSILSKCVNEDLTPVLPSVKAPTLLIWGENDTATPMRDARIMERLIPDTGLVSFPGCGHYSFLDNPGQFAAVLRSFLTAKLNS